MWIIVWFLSWYMNPVTGADLPERTVTELRKECRSLLTQEAKFAERRSRRHVDLIGRMLAMHGALVNHSTFHDGYVLQQTRSRLQSRLVRIERGIRKSEQKRKRGQFKANNADAQNGASPQQIAGIPAFEQLGTFLAQQVGGPFAPGAPFAPQAGGLGAAGGNAIGNGPLPDYGPMLADLIQQVISPEFWDVAGGPGRVVYFAPKQVLVVRATSDVHRRIAEFLVDLRAAGGP